MLTIDMHEEVKLLELDKIKGNDLASKVKRYRIENDLTYEAFAARCNLSAATVSKIEVDSKYICSESTLFKICNLIGLDFLKFYNIYYDCKSHTKNNRGIVIKYYRYQAKLSQRALSKKIGLDQGTIIRYENNNIGSIDTLYKIYDFLNIPSSYC